MDPDQVAWCSTMEYAMVTVVTVCLGLVGVMGMEGSVIVIGRAAGAVGGLVRGRERTMEGLPVQQTVLGPLDERRRRRARAQGA